MSKKLTLLAAGALTALAFAALPAVASAGEFTADCSSGASCTAAVSGGAPTLEDDSGSSAGKISCTSVTGSATQTSGSSTGTATLTFHGCKDEALSTNCTGSGQPAGTIKTNTLVSHLVYIDPTPTILVGVLFTGFNVTFSCAGGLVQKTVTGNIIGKITNPECNTAKASHTVAFEKLVAPAGSQRYKQVTTTGPAFDMTSGSHSSDSTTFATTGTQASTYTEGKTVKLTC